jgi:hypothetical protein
MNTINDKIIVLTSVPPPSDFRRFCHAKWYEHKDEIFLWTGNTVKYDASYYFTKHRWMLRSMFRKAVHD